MRKWLLLLLVGLFLNGCATFQRNDISLETFCKENDAQVNNVVFEWFPVSINDWWLYEGYVGRFKKLVFKASVKDIIDAEGVTSLEMEYEVNPVRDEWIPFTLPGKPFIDEWITFYDDKINFGASVNFDCVKLPLKDGTFYNCFGSNKKWVVSHERSPNKYLDKSFRLQYRGNKDLTVYTRWYKKGIGIVKFKTEQFDKNTNKYVVFSEFTLKDCSINLLNK